MTLFECIVVISHVESGRLKEQFLPFRKNQLKEIKDSLLSEKLIDEKDIKTRDFRLLIGIVLAVIFPLVMSWALSFFNKAYRYTTYLGVLFLLMSAEMAIKMIFRSHKLSIYKQQADNC